MPNYGHRGDRPFWQWTFSITLVNLSGNRILQRHSLKRRKGSLGAKIDRTSMRWPGRNVKLKGQNITDSRKTVTRASPCVRTMPLIYNWIANWKYYSARRGRFGVTSQSNLAICRRVFQIFKDWSVSNVKKFPLRLGHQFSVVRFSFSFCSFRSHTFYVWFFVSIIGI